MWAKFDGEDMKSEWDNFARYVVVIEWKFQEIEDSNHKGETFQGFYCFTFIFDVSFFPF